MPKILFVDDDPVILRTIPRQLRQSGYAVEVGRTLQELEALLAQGLPDLILLDVVLPDGDGRTFCGKLREAPATADIPVILITATRRDERDQVDGLQAGADDYLIKPLIPRLLLAKAATVLRRFAVLGGSPQILAEYGLTLDLQARRVLAGKREARLTRKEFDLLAALLRARRKTLAVSHLLESVWGYDTSLYDDRRTVEVHMSSLRRKLGKAFASRLRTVPGAGYRLE